MDARAWLGLTPTHNPFRWNLPVVPGISTGGGFLFGGCGLGAAIAAMEGTTLRVAQTVETEWVLVDIRVESVFNGFGHGHVYLWSEDGTLMATASQSAIIREASPERFPRLVATESSGG